MPIHTNFAREHIVYHEPLNMSHDQMIRFLDICSKLDYLNVRFESGHLVLTSKPFVLVAFPQELWDLIGEAVEALNQPWWEFAICVADDESYVVKKGQRGMLVPGSHALGIIRVSNTGEMTYLSNE